MAVTIARDKPWPVGSENGSTCEFGTAGCRSIRTL